MLAFFRLLYYFFQLSNAEKFVLIKRQVNDSKPPEVWLSFFSKLHQIHLQQRAARKFLTLCYNVIIFFELVYWFVAVLYLTGAADNRDFGFKMSEYVILLDFPAKILLGVFVLLFFLRKWITTLKLPNHVAAFIIPLLVILKEEVRAKSSIELTANLGERTRRQNYQETKYNYKSSVVYLSFWFLSYLWLLSIPLAMYYFIVYEPSFWGMSGKDLGVYVVAFQVTFFMLSSIYIETFSPSYPRIITKIYRNEWLIFKVKLADKSVVSCQIEEILYEIRRKKKNPRGKIKGKKKHKSIENYALKVKFLSNKYTPKGNISTPTSTEEIQLSNPSTTYYPIKEKRKHKNKVQYPSAPDLKQFLNIVGNAYRKIKKINT